jgi:hypothetical protein
MSPEQIKNWRYAAILDGWSHEPTYEGHESEEHAMRLKKDGWVAQSLNRPAKNRMKAIASLHIWGPDNLAIAVVFPYDWEAMVALLRKCSYCETEDVDTQRVSFAGRCCSNCLKGQQEKQEFPGWCD